MKKLYTLITAILLTTSLWAQAPQSFSYQAVVRGASNELVSNKPVGMKISILQGSEYGNSVYVETHSPTTNTNGLVSVQIGNGTKLFGDFQKIDWAKGPYFVKTETDPIGGTNYSLTNVSQLLSVPYALFAANSQPGPKGDTGAEGAAGKDGTKGTNGSDGKDGAQGPAGKDGTNGIDGKDGAQGPAGKDGTNGIDGKDGAQGPAGKDGTNGIDGKDGAQGPAGKDGTNGIDGKDGAQGPAGKDGAVGPQGPIGLTGPAGKDGSGLTPGKLPTVSSDKVEEIIQDAPGLFRYLKITHTVSDDGGETVLKRGFCISENPTPTTAGKTFSNNYSSSIGVSVDSIFEVKSNQKYYVRAFAVNTKGTAYGNEIVLTTLDIKLPTVSTTSVTDVSYREATVAGNVDNTGNQKPTIGFCVGTQAGLSRANAEIVLYCDTFSNFAKKLTYLQHSTTYYVRAFAENSAGIAYGNELNFSTLKKVIPNIQTISVDSVDYTNATISGKIISDGGDAIEISGMCIGTTNTPTINDIFAYNNNGNGTSIQAITSNLMPNTTYYARAYAKNSAGETYGNALKFNTLTVDITTNVVTDITFYEANFNGELKHNGNFTNFETGFCYSEHSNPTSSDLIASNWNSGNTFNANANNLNSNTTYYVRAFIRKNGNYAYGNEISFKTLSINLTTLPVSNIKGIKANVAGTVSDSIVTLNKYLGFCYSTSPNPSINDLVISNWNYNSINKFQYQITELKPNTTYYVRAFIQSDNNKIIYGNEVSFTSGSIKLPTITTDTITYIDLHSAQLLKTIVDDGGENLSEEGFCIATHTTPTTKDIVLTGNNSNYINNLQINTKYYVRAYAKNTLGLVYGNEISFTTENLKVETVSITKVTFASAEMKAKVTARPKTIQDWGSKIYLLISKKTNPTFQENVFILYDQNNWYYSDSILNNNKQFEPATTYYVKAAVIINSNNTIDTAYGSTLSFTTKTAPKVETFAPTKISSNNVNLSASNTNSNGYIFTQRGFIVSTKPNISSTNQEYDLSSNNGGGIGSFEAVKDLKPNTTFYAKAYISTNDGLCAYGNEISFKTLAIGYKGQGGGIVFYDKGETTNGWRYLEVAPNDQSSGTAWGCKDISIYAQNAGLGAGFENTQNILSVCSDQNSAANICKKLNIGGKSDWYLPNTEEFSMMYLNIYPLNLGDFNQVYYWTSEGIGTNNARLFGISSGDIQDYDTQFTGSVRAVRRY